MIISEPTPRTSVPSRHLRIKADAVTVKIVVTLLFAFLFATTTAVLKNKQRTLLESIRREEINRDRLSRECKTERDRWNACLNAASINKRLADNSLDMGMTKHEQIVHVRFSDVPRRLDAPVVQTPSSVAAR